MNNLNAQAQTTTLYLLVKNMVQEKYHDRSIDIIKGLCIICVVIGHFVPEGLPNWYLVINGFIYSFHMPVFMAMAGYLSVNSLHKSQGILNFARSKALRLMVPYFAISIFIFAIKLLSKSILHQNLSINSWDFLKIPIYPQAAFFLWFSYTLFMIFILVKSFRNFATNPFTLFIFSLAIYFIPFELPRPFCLLFLQKMIPFFALGAVIFKYKQILYKIKLPVASILILVHYIIFAKQTNIPSEMSKITTLGMGSLAIIYLFIIFSKYKDASFLNPLHHIGQHSTAIYIFHTMAMGPIKYVAIKYIGIEGIKFIVISAIAICIGVAFPIILSKTFICRNIWASRLLLGEKW